MEGARWSGWFRVRALCWRVVAVVEESGSVGRSGGCKVGGWGIVCVEGCKGGLGWRVHGEGRF
jgi:hypothetical protein